MAGLRAKQQRIILCLNKANVGDQSVDHGCLAPWHLRSLDAAAVAGRRDD